MMTRFFVVKLGRILQLCPLQGLKVLLCVMLAYRLPPTRNVKVVISVYLALD
jgi:hypothetical protein